MAGDIRLARTANSEGRPVTSQACRLPRNPRDSGLWIGSDHGAAQIASSSSAGVQIAQKAAQTHRVALDGFPTQTLATLLQVRIDIPNAQVCKALLFTSTPSSVRNSSRLGCTLRPCHRCQ